MECFSKCLELKKEHFGEAHPQVRKLQCKIGSYLYNEGEYDEALKICYSAGNDSDNTDNQIKALCILGTILSKRLDHTGCVKAFEEALRLAKLNSKEKFDVSALARHRSVKKLVFS